MLEGQKFVPHGRVAQFVRMLDAFDRDEIEAAVDMLIAHLDAADGDAEIEANGDELDGNGSENDFMRHVGSGSGCPVADPIEPAAWIEWQTRGAHKLEHGGERLVRHRNGSTAREDDEDDDPGEDDDPREDDDSDRCAAGDDQVIAGPVSDRNLWWKVGEIGSEADAEPACAPSYYFDQTMPLDARAANDAEVG